MLNIYLSYRQEDKPLLVKRIYEVLAHEFGANSVVKDVFYTRDLLKQASPNPFGEVQWAINRCEVVLVIIGRQWFTDSQGHSLLTNPKDLIAQELGFVFTRKGLPIIPILIDGAKAPSEAQLGTTFRLLALKNAAIVRDGAEFDRDMMHLIDQLNKLVSGQISGVRSLSEPENDEELASMIVRRNTNRYVAVGIAFGFFILILALLILQNAPQ